MIITCSYMASRKDALEASAAEQFELATRLRESADAYRDFKDCCLEAAMFYRAAAEKGHVEAQFELGMMYQLGLGLAKNFFHAATWYRRAAKQGHGAAMLRLAYLYNAGLGVRKNGITALSWRRKYAELCKARQDECAGGAEAGFQQINPIGRDPMHGALPYAQSTAMPDNHRNGGPNNA